MGHLKTISMKFSANTVPVFLILAFLGGVAWPTALMLSIVLTLLAYFVGDMLILPRTGNTVATVADVLLAGTFLWIVSSLGIVISFRIIAYVAVAVILAEGLFYHPYLKRLVTMDSMGPRFGKRH